MMVMIATQAQLVLLSVSPTKFRVQQEQMRMAVRNQLCAIHKKEITMELCVMFIAQESVERIRYYVEDIEMIVDVQQPRHAMK